MFVLAMVMVGGLAATPVKVAAPDLQVINLDASRGSLFANHFAQQLIVLGLQVVSAQQISAVLGQERQKSMLGCAEGQGSCVAELAAALGSDAIVTGSIAQLSSGSLRVSITIVAGSDARPLSVLSSSASSEDGVFEVLSAEAPRMAQEVLAKLRPGTSLVLPTRGVRRSAWAPAVVGVAAGAIGFALLASAWADSDQLRTGTQPLTLMQARTIAQSGSARQTAGGVLISIGAAGLVSAALMFALGADTPAQLIGFVGPDAVGLALVGRFL